VSHLIRTIVRFNRRTDAYRIHQQVTATATGKRVLWANPDPNILVIQSATTPAWEQIQGAETAMTEPAITTFTTDSTVKFGLIGNPIRTVGKRRPDGSPNTNPGRRPLPIPERPAWLHRKLSPALTITTLNHQRLPDATGRGIVIARHLFQGAATVDDPDALADLITGGVGAGKGFGCGLLIVRDAAS
jgi:CRISPR-associated protein Cas6/Cse3/CasE subtype I-E